MPTEKKLTKEDTWKPAELTKHMRDAGHGDRRREERERKARENTKEEERESRRARDNKDEERERRRSRDPREERHVERKREGAEEREKERRRREGGAEREKGRRREGGEEREKERRREGGAEREKERREGGEEREKERRREGEEREKERKIERDADTRGPDRGPQRHREGERERHKDRARERDIGDEKEKGREEREGHRRREGGREREGEEREKHKEREHREEGDRRHDERPDKARRVRRSEEKEEEKNKEPRRDGDRRRKQEDGERGKEEERERRREKEARRREKEDGGGRDEERERRHRERRQRQVEDVGGGVSTELREPEETKARHHGDQDTGEKERRRARRHPVLPEAAAAGADVPPAASERKAAAEPESAHGEPAYEDDFEEYEEDFEELDESGEEEEQEEEEKEEVVVESPRQKMGAERRKEVEAIQKAMEEENRRAAGGRSGTEEEIRPQESEQTRQGSPHRGSQRGPQRGKFIDFVAAKQREINQKVASKQKKRSTELLRLVELDFSPTFSLLDLPPLSQYDVYIKSFGNTNTKQAYVQCREDDGERDVQTDLIEVLDRWTQHPADHTGACGEPGRSQDAPDGNTAQINIDSQRLATFLHSAVQVMSVLLEEDHAERRSLRTTSSQTDALSFSEGNLQLNTQLPFLHGRPCSLLLFSASQRQTLLSVHGPLAQPGAVRLDSWTLLCVWSMWEPSRPQKVLVYESEVRCCCFSPGRGALVLAGTSDGSLVLWDLREPAGSHHTMTIAGTEWTFRQPTFSTDAVLSALGHHSAVNTIAVLPSPSSTTSTSTSSTAAEPQPPLLASEESAGTSFQLASLDERGVLNLWVVLELTSASLAGSQTDLGLRPGGKVKLLHSSCMPAVEREGADLEALQLHFLPSDANHFLITTNMGVVHHGTVHGFRSPPRDYGSQEGGSGPLNVTSLHFSPFNPQLFLVGCSDGSMRLHIVSSHWPLAEWTTCRGGGAPEVGVVSVRWSQSRPAVFCVLDSASHLHLWDLSRDALGPVATETLHADGVTAMAVFGSASSSSSSNQSSFSGVALAHRTGKLQLHYFNPSFSSANHAEDEGVLQSMMHQAL